MNMSVTVCLTKTSLDLMFSMGVKYRSIRRTYFFQHLRRKIHYAEKHGTLEEVSYDTVETRYWADFIARVYNLEPNIGDLIEGYTEPTLDVMEIVYRTWAR